MPRSYVLQCRRFDMNGEFVSRGAISTRGMNILWCLLLHLKCLRNMLVVKLPCINHVQFTALGMNLNFLLTVLSTNMSSTLSCFLQYWFQLSLNFLWPPLCFTLWLSVDFCCPLVSCDLLCVCVCVCFRSSRFP